MERIYSRDEAQSIADAFPADKLAELIAVATNAQRDPATICSHTPIVLPEGWAYQTFSNCIVAAYQDGPQERKAFFVPRIWIDFKYVDTIEAKKKIDERLPLGYCSCGKPMPLALALLWVKDTLEKKSFWSWPLKAVAYPVGIVLYLYMICNEKQMMSILYNRHSSCL